MRVALVICPVWGTREPPLGLVQVAACLKSRGHEARAFDLNNHLYRRRAESFKNLWAWEQSLFWYDKEKVNAFFSDIASTVEACADEILRFDPALVGFSVAASTYPASVAFAKLLKKKKPSLKITFGGQGYLEPRLVEATFREAPVDFVFAGESDETFPELASCLEQGGDVAQCRGLYGSENGAVRFTGERPPIADLDRLPFMDFSDLRLEDYDDDRHILMMASRGCVWNCAFCSSRTFWKGYRAMSGERIHQEIAWHRATQKRGMSHIDFADLAFNGNMARAVDFAGLMAQYPPFPPSYKMQWNANAIIHPGLTPEVLALLKESGCQRLIFGIESGSERVLKLMRKMYRPEVAVRVIKDAHAAGIKVTCNFMFGFPGETEEDFERTLDFIRAVGPAIDRAYPSRTYCAIEEFSYFHAHPGEFGIRTPFSHHLYWETTDGANTYPVRLSRCQRFEKLCAETGVQVDCGVKTAVEMDEWFNLAHYHEYRREFAAALEYFLKYHERDPKNEVVTGKIREICRSRTDLPSALRAAAAGIGG